MDWNLFYIAQHGDEIFRNLRWPDGITCSCGSHRITRLPDGRYKCKDCGKIFSDKTDTLFHGSKLPISFWMLALYLDLTGKGISSYELARKLQITQKAAYYMLMRLRTALKQDDITFTGPIVAHDEVYIGGDYRNFCLRKRQQLIARFHLPYAPKTVREKIALGNAINVRTKKAAFGITDGDKVVLMQVPTPIKQDDLIEVYRKHVAPGGLAVSDNSLLYKDWDKLTGRELHTNNHSKGQYLADNGTSSNMIENVFSWLERTNTFVQVHYSRKYTQLYLNEFAFRYNTRKMTVQERMTIAMQKCLQRYDRTTLSRLNNMEDTLYREKDFFNPYEFFKTYYGIITEYSEGGLVYRAEDYR
jgi:transposase-like protein